MLYNKISKRAYKCDNLVQLFVQFMHYILRILLNVINHVTEYYGIPKKMKFRQVTIWEPVTNPVSTQNRHTILISHIESEIFII